MKTVRIAAVLLALTLFVTAVVSFAAQPVAAQTMTASSSAPAQAFVDAVMGLPLLAPMSISAIPVLNISVQSTAGKDYACTLVSQKPKDWTKMQRRQSFDAVWTVKNSGTKNWGQHGVDFGYVSGAKMHTYGDTYDLSKDVGPGGKIALVVDMASPKTKGYYTAVWGLYKGSQVFCKLSVTVNVNR
jgi:hypothetical protein